MDTAVMEPPAASLLPLLSPTFYPHASASFEEHPSPSHSPSPYFAGSLASAPACCDAKLPRKLIGAADPPHLILTNPATSASIFHCGEIVSLSSRAK